MKTADLKLLAKLKFADIWTDRAETVCPLLENLHHVQSVQNLLGYSNLQFSQSLQDRHCLGFMVFQ